MRSIKLNYHGKVYHIECTAKAVFDFQEASGKTMIEACKDIKSGFANTCKAIAIMSECGELKRRYMGHDKGNILSEEEMMATASPNEDVMLRLALIEAVSEGYKMEESEEEQEIDVFLQELESEKKTKTKKRVKPVSSGHQSSAD